MGLKPKFYSDVANVLGFEIFLSFPPKKINFKSFIYFNPYENFFQIPYSKNFQLQNLGIIINFWKTLKGENMDFYIHTYANNAIRVLENLNILLELVIYIARGFFNQLGIVWKGL